MKWAAVKKETPPDEAEKSLGRILVLDDEPIVCDMVAEVLSNGGFSCEKAHTASEALDRLSSESFDCLVSDIRMPGMDGIELLKKARAIDPDLEVILMTGLVDANSAIAALKAGASDYIVKPFSVEEILHCVKRAVEHRRLVLETRDYQMHLEEKVAKQAETIRLQFLSGIRSLAKAVEARDPYTRGHSDRVADLAVKIATEMDLDSELRDLVLLAGLLHDIGKIGVPDAILQKKGPLDIHEWDVMKAHPVIGHEIVSQMEPPSPLLEGILHHHERWDGGGYPHGKVDDEIPIVARILAPADAFDAMVSARPYRGAFSPEEAMERLARGGGAQFDPEIVAVALKVLQNDGSRPKK